jgi:hypothetical protein
MICFVKKFLKVKECGGMLKEFFSKRKEMWIKKKKKQAHQIFIFIFIFL